MKQKSIYERNKSKNESIGTMDFNQIWRKKMFISQINLQYPYKISRMNNSLDSRNTNFVNTQIHKRLYSMTPALHAKYIIKKYTKTNYNGNWKINKTHMSEDFTNKIHNWNRNTIKISKVKKTMSSELPILTKIDKKDQILTKPIQITLFENSICIFFLHSP